MGFAVIGNELSHFQSLGSGPRAHQRNGQTEMRTASNSTLYSYWNAVRGKRIAPKRFEIEPSQISEVLSETFILEFIEPSQFRYRLAGTRVGEQFKQELRGTNFVDSWQESDRFGLQRQLMSVRKLGAVIQILMEGCALNDQRAMFEVLILPLQHNSDEISRFLGAFVAIDPPPWLGDIEIGEFRMVETELTYPADDYIGLGAYPDLGESVEPPILSNLRTARVVRNQRRQFRVYDGGLSPRGKN